MSSTPATASSSSTSAAHEQPVRRRTGWPAPLGTAPHHGGSNVDDYMWIPIVGPFVGGLIGAYVYDLTTHDILVARGETADLDLEQRGRTVEETS
jgi:hypothetical protein